MSKEVEYKDLIAFHPGSYVEDIIDDLNITQNEFADRLETSSKTVSKIINGEESISKNIANKLAKLTGIDIKTWLNLQANYDAKVMEIENKKNEDEHHISELIDLKALKTNGFIEDKRYSVQERISRLRILFNVSNLTRLSEFDTAVSYRIRSVDEKAIVNSNVMLELAMNQARNATSNKYNRKKLEDALPVIHQMITEDPSVFYEKIQQLLIECGIVLVALPNFSGAQLHGATKKFKNGSVLLLITDRQKKADIFWFSLIHELAHIYNEDFYSNVENQDEYQHKEELADKFASNFLIPDIDYEKFISAKNFTEDSIVGFANQIDVLPGIVLGRLQKDQLIGYDELNHLMVRYKITYDKNK